MCSHNQSGKAGAILKADGRINIDSFIAAQLAVWPQAAERFEALKSCLTRDVELPGGERWQVSFNPARIVSSAAKVDAKSIADRPCFLCESNRPSEQTGIGLGDYTLLLNPFPIFLRHLTIAANAHVPQQIAGRGGEMASLATLLPDFTIFYNGPRCGASAPDHFHFQAVGSESLPLLEKYPFSVVRFVVDTDMACEKLDEILRTLPTTDDQPESPVNILCKSVGNNRVEFVIIPRRKHRPSNFGPSEGEILVSPASVDLGGTMVAPRPQEWEKLDADTLQSLFRELCYPADSEYILEVGVLSASEVTIDFTDGFDLKGEHKFRVSDGHVIDLTTGKSVTACTPTGENSRFTVKNVMIGIDFHWQQHLDQTFTGAVRLVADGEKVVVINEIDLEEYLISVISSEMSATSSPDLLRAHAIISRSWVMNQVMARGKRGKTTAIPGPEDARFISYTDRDAHSLFDVCADDHCQRYQGITRVTSEEVRRAVEATRGIVLADEAGELCDARFSKCCGGVMEEFSACWQDVDYSYLRPLRDNPQEGAYPEDLRVEKNARSFILNPLPGDYCNCKDEVILRQVLNNFDQATADFYRWEVSYSVAELSELIKRRSGIDFGTIMELHPIKRGASGRIIELEIMGDKRSMVVGKELTIRRWLSESHLRSSAFIVEHECDRFILRGAGWGHGVGLCQIGAAVMASKGIPYTEILAHYYPGSRLLPLQTIYISNCLKLNDIK